MDYVIYDAPPPSYYYAGLDVPPWLSHAGEAIASYVPGSTELGQLGQGIEQSLGAIPGWLGQAAETATQTAAAPFTAATNVSAAAQHLSAAAAQAQAAAAQAEETARIARERIASTSRHVENTSDEIASAAKTVKWVAIGVGALGGIWILASLLSGE